jgi:hypothetical protein
MKTLEQVRRGCFEALQAMGTDDPESVDASLKALRAEINTYFFKEKKLREEE